MRTAICIASGPSLTQQDVDLCKGKGKVYAVKECHLLAPWADVLYAADTDWWQLNKCVPEFIGERWTVSYQAKAQYGDMLHHIPYDSQLAWSDSLDVLATGGNSGFQALNLAVLQGAERVILLGYDMGFVDGANKHWWTGKIHRHWRPSQYDDWIRRFNEAAKLIKVPVYNATRNTNLKCFPIVKLEDILA